MLRNDATGNMTCTDIKAEGSCDADFVIKPEGQHAGALGSYCAVTCGRCRMGEPFCGDREVPRALSGKLAAHILAINPTFIQNHSFSLV